VHSRGKNNNVLAEYILEFTENSYVVLDVIYYSITEFQRFVTCLINVLLCNRYILCLVSIAIDDLINSFRFYIKETDFNGLESTAPKPRAMRVVKNSFFDYRSNGMRNIMF